MKNRWTYPFFHHFHARRPKSQILNLRQGLECKNVSIPHQTHRRPWTQNHSLRTIFRHVCPFEIDFWHFGPKLTKKYPFLPLQLRQNPKWSLRRRIFSISTSLTFLSKWWKYFDFCLTDLWSQNLKSWIWDIGWNVRPSHKLFRCLPDHPKTDPKSMKMTIKKSHFYKNIDFDFHPVSKILPHVTCRMQNDPKLTFEF